MTVPYRKKLIEVALPLKAINEASAREKEPFTRNHPRSLHIWWARRPLVACRAVLFCSLVDDPDSDPAYRKPDGSVDEDRAGIKRAELFNLIEELVQWENSNNPRVINSARAEIARCVASRKIELGEFAKDTIIFGDKKGQKHPKGPMSGDGITAWEILLMKAKPDIVNAFLAEYAPPVLDPFAGGGSIPLEAQRLGLRAYASDLNPVPVLINKALIELPPKFAGRPPVNPEWQAKSDAQKAVTVWQGAQGLSEDVRYYGQYVRLEAEKRFGHLYPKVTITKDMTKKRPDLQEYLGEELTIVAWIWARTVASPNPVCRGHHVPLVRSFWLSTKAGKQAWIDPIIDNKALTYTFEVNVGKGEPRSGTIGKQADVCLLTGSPVTRAYIREEGMAGRLGSCLMAVVAEGRRERVYLSPTLEQESVAHQTKLPETIPDTDIVGDTRYLTPTTYGMTKYRHLFTNRQLVALSTLCDIIKDVRTQLVHNSAMEPDYADAVATYLALAVSRWADLSNTICSWNTTNQNVRALFARQAISMSWDYVELSPFSSVAPIDSTIDAAVRTLSFVPANVQGKAEQLDAQQALPRDATFVISTDPPYYDNVPYADLSDFFYIWLRRCLQNIYPNLLSTVLVPKAQELVADPFRQGGKDKARSYFERGMGRVFDALHFASNAEYPITVYYAFKQAEDDDEEERSDREAVSSRTSTGWETFLQSLIDSHWYVDGTWPMRTERGTRTRGLGSNALASSIVLVCRPRPIDAQLATRKQFMNDLRRELPDALKNLQHGNIAPVDLAQSVIGPGMAVFTRYTKVIESDGSQMSVRTALGIINQVLDEVLAEQEGDFDTDTRWALAWFEQFGMKEEAFGVAETLSKAKNTAINGLVEAGIVKAKSGKVQLVSRTELPEDWNPATDKRLTVWETTQHLIRTLETKGEGEAAALLNKLGGMGETARDLAYRLYSICERKKWADEALAYNSLVIAWPELTKLARSQKAAPSHQQADLFGH